jgi:archaellum component FlaC
MRMMDAETSGRFDAVDRRFDAVDQRFEAVDQRFDAVDQRFDAVDRRFDAVDQRLDRMDRRFDGIDERLDGMDQRFDGIDLRLGALDQKVDEKFDESKRYFGVLVERLEGKLDLIAEGYRDIDRRLGEFRAWTETAIGNLDRRVMRLESRRRPGGPRR